MQRGPGSVSGRCRSGESGRGTVLYLQPRMRPPAPGAASDGPPHRADGPAQILTDEDGGRHEHWYLRHRRHRTDGPAIIERARDGSVRKAEWWVGGWNVTDIAEAFLAETKASWPLDRAHESAFLRWCVRELRREWPSVDGMGWGSIATAACLASLFWVPLVLTVVLLWE